jgi:general secretion pathway protein J
MSAHLNRRQAAPRSTQNAGFSLMEMLVAVALMGLVLSALAAITAQWVPNWNRGFVRVQRNELVDISLSRLAEDVGAAEFIPQNRKELKPLFDGSELAVVFVRSAFGPNAKRGLEIVRIAQTADRNGLVLVRSRAPYGPSEPGTNSAVPAIFNDQVALLRAPYRVSFAYAGRDGVWRTSWSGNDGIPARVRFTVRDAASERALAVSTATLVHVDMPAECVHPKKKQECEKLFGKKSNDGQQSQGPNAQPSPSKGG